MATISVSLPSDGTTADVSDYNTPITTIVTAINGGLDDANIASAAAIARTKIASSTTLWEELARTTLSVAGDSISVTSIPARKYLRVLIRSINSGSTTSSLRFNNDSSANYAYRLDVNNGTTSTATGATSITGFQSGSDTYLLVLDIMNFATSEKAVNGVETTVGTGAGTAPARVEISAKWVNTTDQITRIDLLNGGAGDFNTNSEVVVLGHD